MSSRPIPSLLVLLPFALLAACAPAEEREEIEEDTLPEMEEAAAPEVEPPDTTAAAVWAHLQQANYRESWALWPGKARLYQGQEPHGALLTTYLNPLALDAVTNRAGTLPTGSIIVKENYAPDSTFAAATVMYKVDGYNPEHADWFWMKRNADGTIEVEGRGEMCIACHAQDGGAENDYIRTASIR